MELRVNLKDDFIDGLRKDMEATGVSPDMGTSGPQLARDAFSLYRWAVSEAAKGRVVISTDSHGSDPQRVVMPNLIPRRNP